MFQILIVFGFLAPPIALIWGWARWALLPKQRTVTAVLSLVGLVLATVSALLGVFVVGHAVVTGGYPYYDPRAMRIYAWGILFSIAGFVFGIGGVWRPSSLRWHAPVSAVCTLAFWLAAAAWE